jgi:hypothetical protein
MQCPEWTAFGLQDVTVLQNAVIATALQPSVKKIYL